MLVRTLLFLSLFAACVRSTTELDFDCTENDSCGKGLFLLQMDSKQDLLFQLDSKRDLRHVSSHALHDQGNELAFDSELLQAGKQSPSGTEVTHKSWFERLGDAIASVFVGLFVVIPFSIALLWVNERRNAQLESLIGHADAEAETVDAKQKDVSEYDGTLVHLEGEMVRGLDPVADKRFPAVKMETGCLMLTSDVEVYQWEETEHSETKKDKVGGGETTTKTYSYKKVWSSSIINSSVFHQGGHTNSVQVTGLSPGSKTEINPTVKIEEHYFLPEALTMQVTHFQDASKLAGDALQFDDTYTFKPDGGFFYYPAKHGEPNIGDFRVKLTYAPDGPGSILALQMKDKKHDNGHTFGPYRAVPRGLCMGVSDEDLKRRLLVQAKKDGDDLYEEDKCWDFGPFMCLCCCCNVVTYCFTHLSTSSSAGVSLTPEILSGWAGKVNKKNCLDSVKRAGKAMKWVIRILGWLLLWAGFNALFTPLEVILDIIPFLGPYLGSGATAVMGAVNFILTMVVASLLVSVAYMIYHPIIGLLYLSMTTGIVVGIGYLAKVLSAKQKHA